MLGKFSGIGGAPMKTSILFPAIAITACVCFSTSSAGDPPAPQTEHGVPKDGTRELRSDGYARWREFARSVTYLQLVGLLEHQKLVDELRISEVNQKRIVEFRQWQRMSRELIDRKEGKKKGPPPPRDPAVGMEALKSANEKAKQLIDEVLSDAGFERLVGLYAQLHGYSSVLRHTEVSKRIGISEQELARMLEKQEHLAENAFEEIRELVRMGAGRDEIAAEFQEMRDSHREMVKSSLTNEQLNALQKLQGEKFEFPREVVDAARGAGGSFRWRPPSKDGPSHRKERLPDQENSTANPKK